MPKRKSSPVKRKQKKSLPPLIIGFLVVIGIMFFGCWFIRKQVITNELGNIIRGEWNAYTMDKPNFPGGVAMMVLSPKGDYFISTGMGEGMRSNYHFRTASISKTFTAAGIMLLHQQGKLNIEDKITDLIPGSDKPYIPDTSDYAIPHKNEITIRMLINHRAGVFDIANSVVEANGFSRGKPYVGNNYLRFVEATEPTHTFTFDELVGVVADNQQSYFVPGTAYKYSDTGYSMLGKIIEQVSSKSYAEFIQDELLIPNGLLDTKVIVDGSDLDMPVPFTKGYNWTEEQMEDVTRSNMSPHVAEGSVMTTPRDLALWGKKLFSGQAGLTKETVQMMIDGCMSTGGGATTAVNYGLGLICKGSWYGHNGAHEGYLSNMMHDMKTGVTYVIFTNTWDCATCGTSLDSIKGELLKMDEISEKILHTLGY